MSAGVGTLLRCQWRAWRNQWRPDSRYRGYTLTALLIAPLFMVALFVATLYFLNHSGMLEMLALAGTFSIARQAVAELVLEALALSSTTTFAIMALGALEQAFETFYLGRDLPLLLVSPLSRRAILAFKFIANMQWDAVMILVTAAPIWLAFAVWLGAPALYYVALVLGWMCVLVLVSGLGVALAMVLVRIIPLPRLRQIMLSSFLSVALAFVVAVQSLVTGVWNRDSILHLLERRALAQQVWLPSVWLSRGLTSIILGHISEAWPWLGALALVAGLALGLAYAIAARLYSAGWSSAQTAESQPARGIRRRNGGRSLSAVWALVAKDLRLFFRQPMQWYQAALGTVAIVMVLINFAGQKRDATSAMILALVMSYVGAGTFAMNLSLRGVTREGVNWWILQSCPLSEAQILRGKFLTAFMPTVLYAILALVGMHAVLRLSWLSLALTVPILLALVLDMTALDVAVGIWRTDFRLGETRNADVVAVLVSQFGNYLLLSPVLLTLAMSDVWVLLAGPSRLMVPPLILSVLFLPVSLLVWFGARRYSLRALRALRLSEDIPALT